MLEKQQGDERRKKRSNRKILDQSSYRGPETRIKHSAPYFHFSAYISSWFTFKFSASVLHNTKNQSPAGFEEIILPPNLKNIHMIE